MSRISTLLPLLLYGLPALASGQEAPTVFTVRLQPENFSRVIRLPATVLPYAEVTLIPHVTGYVTEVTVREGAWVKRGEVLARIDVPLMAQDVARREAGVQAAAARINEAKGLVVARESAVKMHASGRQRAQAEVDLRRVQLERVQRLVETRAATEEELDEAKGQLAIAEGSIAEVEARIQLAQADIQAALAAVQSAEAELALAQAELDKLQAMAQLALIRCPYEKALVVERLIDPGALVQADETPVLRLMELEQVRVRMEIDERDAVHVEAGNVVALIPDAPSLAPRQATVTRTTVALDPATRRMGVEIDIANAAHELRPGMFLHADVDIYRRKNVLLVSPRALRFEDGGMHVFIVELDRLVRRQVQAGVDDGLRVEIVSGLAAGDEVVTAGAESLPEGTKVQHRGDAAD